MMADYLLAKPSGFSFRYTIPSRFKRVINKREIKFSLATNHRNTAKSRARKLLVCTEELLSRIARKRMDLTDSQVHDLLRNEFRNRLDGLIADHIEEERPNARAQLVETDFLLTDFMEEYQEALALGNSRIIAPQAEAILSEAGYKVDNKSPRFKAFCRQYLRASIQIMEAHRDILKGKSTPDEVHYLETTQTTPEQPHTETTTSPLLSEAIDKYCSEKLKAGSWTPKTEDQNRATLTQLLEILSDIPIENLKADKAREWKATLLKLPKNANKLPQYKGMSVIEIANKNEGETITIATYNNIHNRANGFFKWAYRQGYTERNYFDGLKVKENTKAKDKRAPFSDEDLKKLFTTPQYVNHKFLHPHYYWIPLLGLFTGARLEELCQLHLDDIRLQDGVWCINVSDAKDDQKTKTNASNRLIPIHTKLIELGLLKHKERLTEAQEERLFPNLKRQRDGYSQSTSKWFGRYRDDVGMKGLTPMKDFHSFRHTLATRLKQQDIPEGITGAIVGHTTGEGITYGRYGKNYLESQLKDAIELLDFNNALAAVKPFL